MAEQRSHTETASLEEALDLLAFHEGSEELRREGGHLVVWINAEDFRQILAGVRAGRDALLEILQYDQNPQAQHVARRGLGTPLSDETVGGK